MNKTIASVVVTYNRKELLLQNLLSCYEQRKKIDKLIIVDNHSTDGTKEYIYEKLSNEQIQLIDYIYLNENTGGSGGFYYGTKYAYERGYDYIWLMDDDGRPLNDETLLNLFSFIDANELFDKPIMINSLVLSSDNDLSFGVLQDKKIIFKKNEIKHDFINKFCNAYNGTLISKELIDKVGFPRGDYFIKGDEKEFLLRVNYYHEYCGTVTNSLYYHPSPAKDTKSVIFLGKRIVNNIEPAWKEYYNMRNVCINYKHYKRFHIIYMLKYYLVRCFKIMIFSNERKKILCMSTQGFYHAIKGITGIYYFPNGEKNKNYNNICKEK